jgi:hypothetical protein
MYTSSIIIRKPAPTPSFHKDVQKFQEKKKDESLFEDQFVAESGDLTAVSATEKWQMKPPLHTPMINLKCAECEEEEKLQMQVVGETMQMKSGTDLSSSENQIASIALNRILNNSKNSGQLIPENMRQHFGNKIGADFSNVKIHTDNSAVLMNNELGAQAFAHGNHIYFNKGKYNPASAQGKHLLAHELTHVVQQGASEKRIMKFGSDEHRRIGEATTTDNTLVTGFGRISFGEMIALGDYFENVEEMARISEMYMGTFGDDQIRYALHLVNPAIRHDPHVSQSVIDEVMNRYYRLAARNETHFSTGSSPGRSNREQYINMHTQAIQDAFAEGNNPLIVRRWTWDAREGFAQHYLTDAFSSGHVRTPRGEITRYWNSLYPNFSNNLVEMISCYMASHINERDNIGYLLTVNGLAERIAPVIRQQAGNVLAAFSIGDLISKVLHDADNAGLDVISARGIGGVANFRWRAVGDEHLFPTAGSTASAAQQQTQLMVQEASRISYDEGRQAYSAGISSDFSSLARLSNPANFGALPYIPLEDASSVTNPTYAWRATDIRSLPANIKSLIIAAFAPGTEIRHELDTMNVACLTQQSGFDLHTRDAFLCFKNHFIANIWQTIVDVAEGNLCPPGQDDPCPTIRNSCP